jgi:hypothetical protein
VPIHINTATDVPEVNLLLIIHTRIGKQAAFGQRQ